MKFLGLLFMGMAIVSLCAGEGRETLKLKAGSYNLRYLGKDVAPNDWPNRGPRVVALLKREKFDIFGAQEAMVPQIATIESENGYRCIGRGREAGGGGEYSCIFYDPERFDCLKENTFWLSETPEAPGSDHGEAPVRVSAPTVCSETAGMEESSCSPIPIWTISARKPEKTALR